MRSGAPSTAIDASEPPINPASQPRSCAMRAEIGSNTEASSTLRWPAKMARSCWRESFAAKFGFPLMRVAGPGRVWRASRAPLCGFDVGVPDDLRILHQVGPEDLGEFLRVSCGRARHHGAGGAGGRRRVRFERLDRTL